MRYLFILLVSTSICAQDNSSSTTWLLNRTDTIGGYPARALNDLPALVTGSDALFFDGVDDALFIENNPLGDAESFTIEIMTKPDSSSNTANFEQRYLHIRRQENDDRRIMMELRLAKDQKWYMDTYIRSELNNRTLVDTGKVHPAGVWYHIALVYNNGMMRHYVNGVEEASGEVTYMPIGEGQTSIGARQNPKSWFKGSINLIKFTRRALLPHEFFFNISDIKDASGSVSGFFLFQNYPNPFNPTTNFGFQIPASRTLGSNPGFVQLKIFDILGNEVAVVLNGEISPGKYEIPFDAGNLASGVYIYRLQNRYFTDTKKMLLIR